MSNVESLITEHIDTWASAIKTKSSAGRGSSKKRELYGVKKLRELILELAIRGMLVPQKTTAEPATELLKTISNIKDNLVEKKVIKKQKEPIAIEKDEVPFELPQGWEWARLQSLCLLENGDRSKNYPNKSLLVDSGVPFVNAGHLTNGKINELEMTFITEERYDLLKAGKFTVGDILFCLRGSLGKSAIIDNIEKGAIASSLVIIRLLGDLNRQYFHHYFNSPLSYKMIKNYDNGTAQPNLSAADLAKFLVPVPPLTEQIEITIKVNELMALCDQLEQQTNASIDAHEELVSTLLKALTNTAASSKHGAEQFKQAWERIAENFDILFTTEKSVEKLKQAILQLAVMGKLVPQDPNDEPASLLLEKIEAEKEQLIKDKKIKKQKPLPEISDDEKPFELPHGWEFERIGTFGIVGTGATPSRSNSNYWNPAVINWVSSGETSELFVGTTKEKVSELAIKETNVSVYPIGTLIVAMYGQGKTRGQITELTEEAGTNQACATIQLVDKSPHHKDYVKLYFRKSYAELRSLAAGGAQPNLNVGKVANTILAIPPLEEQKKIVAKTEQLLCICDELVEKINIANKKQLKLADAIVNKSIS